MAVKNVTICFPIRQGAAYLCQLKQQINGLDYPAANIRIIAIEGDSSDGTPGLLATWAASDSRLTVITHNTGRAKWGSVIDPIRFAHLAEVFNAGLNAVDCVWSDYVLFMPADVEFRGDIIKRLLAHNVDYVAPMYWVREGGGARFYDIWGFKEDGFQWGPYSPEYYEQANRPVLVEMRTVGGMILIHAALIAAGARYAKEDVDHGLCRAAQQMGATVYADTTTHIYHR